MVDISPAVVKTVCGAKLPGPLRTATPVANGANRRHSAALSEFEPPFLNGVQRSVNRKVQGSNPCSGAKSEYESGEQPRPRSGDYISSTSVLHQLRTRSRLGSEMRRIQPSLPAHW